MEGSFQLTFPKRVLYFPLWHGATSADGTVAIRHQDEGRPKACPVGNRGSSVSQRPRRFAWQQRRGDDALPRKGRVVRHRVFIAEACGT